MKDQIKADKKRAEFALRCREVRMYLAKHPGTNEFTIKQALDRPVWEELIRLENLGLIHRESNQKKGRHETLWYVSPQ